jgi:hypothetical protein
MTSMKVGNRRPYVLTVHGVDDAYPRIDFRAPDAIFVATPSVVDSVVASEKPNEFGFSEIVWCSVGEIRLWAAIAFAIREGEGFTGQTRKTESCFTYTS